MRSDYEARIRRLENRLHEAEAPFTPATDLARGGGAESHHDDHHDSHHDDHHDDHHDSHHDDHHDDHDGYRDRATHARPKPELLDLSLRGLFAAGSSTAREEQLRILQLGGHDPANRGFTLQELELGFTGGIAPYLVAEAYLSFNLDPDAGESFVEIEEAFLESLSLPFDLRLKAGHFLTDFGRINPLHTHAWAFANAPVVSTRMFGADGLRSTGAELSWEAPLPWHSRLGGAVQNAKGETLFSFLANEELGGFGGHAVREERDIRSLDDLLFSARWLNSFDLGEELETSIGLSGAWGPNRTGANTHTQIYGLDLHAHWQPGGVGHDGSFLALTAELMVRRYEAATSILGEEGHEEEEDEGHHEEEGHGHGFGFLADLVTESRPYEELWDWGLYTQLEWGFATDWVAAARYGYADGHRGAPLDPSRSQRHRGSANVTWFPNELSKWRLQYDLDWADFTGVDDTEHSFWLQFEFSLGGHGDHDH